MNRNRRRRYQNEVPFRALSPWVLAAIALLIGGGVCVYYKNQLYLEGKEVTRLEEELRRLKIQNDGELPAIARHSSRAALQQRLNDGFIKLVPITQDRLVQISLPPNAVATVALDNEIRPVSNPGVSR